MKKWLSKLYASLGAKLTTLSETVSEERGDTNFVSILIILGIVVLLAGVFIGFKDTIINKVKEIINGLQFE